MPIRTTWYNPDKKYNVIFSTRLVSKIPQDQTTMMAIRPKRPKATKSSASTITWLVSSTRQQVGMMVIIC